MAEQYNKKEQPKNTRYVFRPSTTTQQLVELYQNESSTSRTKALEELIQLGGTVWLQKVYKGSD